LLIDAYGYAGTYKNFISRRDAVQFTPAAPQNPQYYSLVVNAPGQVKTYGWGFSADYLFRGYKVGVNVSSDVLNNVPAGFRAFFNSPKYRTNLSLGHDGFGKKKIVGFSFAWRWQDSFFFQGDFANGQLPAFHSVDGSINFRVTKIKSLIKVGGSNLMNSYYRTAIANPAIGGLYYVSFAYNVL
jgi:hypothetical protein